MLDAADIARDAMLQQSRPSHKSRDYRYANSTPKMIVKKIASRRIFGVTGG